MGAVAAGPSVDIPGSASSSFARVSEDGNAQAYRAHFSKVAGIMAELVRRLDDKGDISDALPPGIALSLSHRHPIGPRLQRHTA